MEDLQFLKLASYTYSLPLGRIILQYPTPLPIEQLDIIIDWLDMCRRVVERQREAALLITSVDGVGGNVSEAKD